MPDKILTFDVYYKLTFLDRYLNFYSQHLVNHKKGVIIGMVFLILNIIFHQKNFINIINISLKIVIRYHLFLILHIRDRLKYHFKTNKLMTVKEKTKY